jgi:hypothetical protein
MMQLQIILLDLSQFHSGQIVETTAHVCRDLEGTWHSVVTRYDRSDRTTSVEHGVHETRRAAEKEIHRHVLVVSDRHATVPFRRINRLLKGLAAVHVSVNITFNPVTLMAAVDGEECQPSEIEDRVAAIADGCLEIELGGMDGYDWVRDEKKTEAARKAIALALRS